jgi:hypothetical protein
MRIAIIGCKFSQRRLRVIRRRFPVVLLLEIDNKTVNDSVDDILSKFYERLSQVSWFPSSLEFRFPLHTCFRAVSLFSACLCAVLIALGTDIGTDRPYRRLVLIPRTMKRSLSPLVRNWDAFWNADIQLLNFVSAFQIFRPCVRLRTP